MSTELLTICKALEKKNLDYVLSHYPDGTESLFFGHTMIHANDSHLEIIIDGESTEYKNVYDYDVQVNDKLEVNILIRSKKQIL